MRRFFVGMALFTLAAVTPLAAWGGDREIAEQIYAKLQGQKNAGVLQGFDLGLDVKEGRVLLKGHVSSASQKTAVLAAAKAVDGVSEVVDQIRVGEGDVAQAPAKPTPVKVDPVTAEVAKAGTQAEGFSLSKALVEQSPAERAAAIDTMVRPAGTTEPVAVGGNDQALKANVMSALGAANRRGELVGFGVSVSATDGDVLLRGEASNAQVKQQIMEMVRRMPGVRNVIDDISVRTARSVAPVAAAVPMPNQAPRHLQPVEVQTVANRVPMRQDGTIGAAAPLAVEAEAYGQGAYDTNGYVGSPVPMAPIPQAYGAPMYDSPNLPNYAWPGYAAYPNYAALTYPQQYSPTAWPYIGPFYPYPQVPLGWRKVSLEWDDGWWMLDFTDK
jgi:osmotically-inducible protein OsmY